MSERPSNEEIIAGIADALPFGIWVARAPGGEFVFANQTFQEIMGMAARPDVARGAYAEPYQIRGTDGELYPESSMPFVRALEESDRKIVVLRADTGTPHGKVVEIMDLIKDSGAEALTVATRAKKQQ